MRLLTRRRIRDLRRRRRDRGERVKVSVSRSVPLTAAEQRDLAGASRRLKQTFEAPHAAPELVADFRRTLSDLRYVREAYLVGVRRLIEGEPETRQLGILIRVRDSWRPRSHRDDAVLAALAPFYLPLGTGPLGWFALTNQPVSEEIRAVGVVVKADRST